MKGGLSGQSLRLKKTDENEVHLVNNLADAVVANTVANGVMQHPEVPQDSHSVSSDVQAFFRAQGAPVTLELPIPNNASANRVVPVAGVMILCLRMTVPLDRLLQELVFISALDPPHLWLCLSKTSLLMFSHSWPHCQ
jgi:hypothetical protein